MGMPFEVFYDGACPLCMREINMLKKMDKKSHILFTDIAAPGFDSTNVGLTMEQLMDEIHGRMPDGSIIKGVEVFRQLYSAVGLSPIVALTRLSGIKQLLDFGYKHFAKNRLRLTGRCTPESCEVPQQQ